MPIRISEKAPRIAEILLAAKGVDFPASGPIRVDVRKPLAFAEERREILRALAEAVRTEAFDVVAGGPSEGVPLGLWIADLVGLPYVSVRKTPGPSLEGEFKPGQEALLVEERAAEGGAIAELVDALRGAGAVCRHAVVVVADGPLLEVAGITLHALTTWPHLIDAAERSSFLSADRLRALRRPEPGA